MSKRLQVLVEEAELREWVRPALRTACRREPLGDAGKKLEIVRAASGHAFPTGDVGQILAEIERGYLGQSRR